VRISLITNEATATVPLGGSAAAALVFGPFDNGPLVALTSDLSIVTWHPAGVALVRRKEEAHLVPTPAEDGEIPVNHVTLLVQKHRRIWVIPHYARHCSLQALER
jgi:hypothetical protein